MTGLQILGASIALGYPVFAWQVRSFNARTESALRRRGYTITTKGSGK